MNIILEKRDDGLYSILLIHTECHKTRVVLTESELDYLIAQGIKIRGFKE